MTPELITLFMFATMMVLLFTGQRVFGVIGFVGSAAGLWLWGNGAVEMPFNQAFQVLNWYPLITVPFFVFMGYMLSESGIASNLYRMFHVWFGPVPGGLAIGTILENADQVIRWARILVHVTFPPPPPWLENVPLLGSYLTNIWAQLAAMPAEELGGRLSPHLGRVLTWFASQAGTIGMMFVHILLTLALATFLYARGEKTGGGVVRFARRVAGKTGENSVYLAAQAIRAVALGVVVTALVQAILAGIGLIIVGMPYTTLLTALVFMFAVAQIGSAPAIGMVRSLRARISAAVCAPRVRVRMRMPPGRTAVGHAVAFAVGVVGSQRLAPRGCAGLACGADEPPQRGDGRRLPAGQRRMGLDAHVHRPRHGARVAGRVCAARRPPAQAVQRHADPRAGRRVGHRAGDLRSGELAREARTRRDGGGVRLADAEKNAEADNGQNKDQGDNEALCHLHPVAVRAAAGLLQLIHPHGSLRIGASNGTSLPSGAW